MLWPRAASIGEEGREESEIAQVMDALGNGILQALVTGTDPDRRLRKALQAFVWVRRHGRENITSRIKALSS